MNKDKKKGITDELRECMRTATRFYEDMRNPYNDRELLSITDDELTAIADRIDDQHDAELQAEYINGYHKALEEVKDGYIKLPVDADGVPIHLGDELTDGMNLPAKVGALLLDSCGWWCKGGENSTCVSPSTLRHVQPDSWERIIADALQGDERDGAPDTHEEYLNEERLTELVERCRRLADDRRRRLADDL